MLNNAKVVVVTRPAEDFPEKDRKSVIENTQKLEAYVSYSTVQMGNDGKIYARFNYSSLRISSRSSSKYRLTKGVIGRTGSVYAATVTVKPGTGM